MEILGRVILALLRIALVLEFIWNIGQGVIWLVSPPFRRKVRDYPDAERYSVYFGAFMAVLGLVALGAAVVAMMRSL